MLFQLVDATGKVRDAVLQNLFGNLFLIENNNVPNRAYPMLQILANRQYL
jgi:hypothetical protein